MAARKPKSPIDDLGKWIIGKGGKQLSQSELKNIKRYARGIGWSKSYEKSGLDKAVDSKLKNKATGLNSWKDSTTGKNRIAKTKDNALALHKDSMFYKKQDKAARVYGDSSGPHERFFNEMKTGNAPRKEFNKRANAAWNAEVEIGRKQGMATNKNARKALTSQPPKAVRTRAKKAAPRKTVKRPK